MTGTPDSYAEYTRYAGDADGARDVRFTDWLRERAGADWTASTDHRFTRELADDILDDAVFRRYLVQDYRFVDHLTRLVGHAAATAPTIDARVRLAEFLAVVGTDENDYFERSFDALGVPPEERESPELTPTTRAFVDLVGRARTGGYAEALAVFVPAEWVYREWATRAAGGKRPARFYLAEWVDLHANEEFDAFVDWLRGQLDAVGPDLSSRRERRVDALFRRTVELEAAFFDAAYESRASNREG